MKKCVEIALDRGRKAMFGLLKKTRKLQLYIQTQIDLFHKLVLPVISYGSEIWAYEDLSKIDSFHLKFLRFILVLNKGTPIPMIYGETGEYPISIILKGKLIGYFAKLQDKTKMTLSSLVYELQHKMYTDGYYTTHWLFKVNSLLAEMNMLYVSENQVAVPSNIL